jgi:hypothetical protein
MRRVLIAAGLLLASWGFTPAPAEATPGMVTSSGCHNRPKHCHPRSSLRKNKRGRLYAPWGTGR